MHIILISSILISISERSLGKFNDIYCEESVFYKPYARFYRELGGSLIFQADSGFRTLQTVADLYMCVNGPALFYTNLTATQDGENQFSGAKFGLFVHECIFINSMKGQTGSGNSLHPPDLGLTPTNCTIPNQNASFPNDPRPSFETRLWGIQMLGDPTDYRITTIDLFFDMNYEVRTDQVFTVDLNSPPPRRATSAHGLSIVTIAIQNETQCIQFDLVDHGILELPDGLMNPELQICFRAQNANDTWAANITDISQVGLNLGDDGGGCAPGTEFQLLMADCIRIPDYKDECKKRLPDIDLACKLMKIVIGVDIPTFPVGAPWHPGVLKLFDDTFMRICPQIPRNYVSYISLLMKYYASEAVTAGAILPPHPRPFWTFVNRSLTECSDNVRPLRFSELEFQSISHYKENVKFIKESTPPGVNDKPLTLFYFQEFADRKYLFNRIVEMQWIIFATVLGVCPMHYSGKTASTSSRMYTMFSEDFLVPLHDFWINPDDNLIYEIILAEFVSDEIHTKALSCLEAAYVQSDSVGFRFPRPLDLNCTDSDNFFIELPPSNFYSSQP